MLSFKANFLIKVYGFRRLAYSYITISTLAGDKNLQSYGWSPKWNAFLQCLGKHIHHLQVIYMPLYYAK